MFLVAINSQVGEERILGSFYEKFWLVIEINFLLYPYEYMNLNSAVFSPSIRYLES
jgi:hypothetical protein